MYLSYVTSYDTISGILHDPNTSNAKCMRLTDINNLLLRAKALIICLQSIYLHYVKFFKKVTASKVVNPHKLPPTEKAAQFCSLTVHLQVMLWKMLTPEEYQLHPEKLVWRLDGTKLKPIMTDLPAAPETLLKYVRCP